MLLACQGKFAIYNRLRGKSIKIFLYGAILFPSGIPRLFCCFLPCGGSFTRCRRLPISAAREGG
jgi:hypothetical protein